MATQPRTLITYKQQRGSFTKTTFFLLMVSKNCYVLKIFLFRVKKAQTERERVVYILKKCIKLFKLYFALQFYVLSSCV